MTLTSAPRFSVVYRITPDDARPVEAHAKDICIEETVEIPEDVVPDGHWKAGIVGIVESITERKGVPTDYDVVISYRTDIANNQIPNLINVMFGNISMRRGIKIVDFELTDEQLQAFGGPRFGVDGLRKALNVFGRPLATTAIKPMGLSSKELAAKCSEFTRGGLDIVKDDHGLINQHFHPFEDRVARIQDVLHDSHAKTGKLTHYYPMLAGRFDELEGQVAFAKRHGVQGLLVPPFLIGPDTGFALARKYDMIVMTHPSFTGTHFHDPRHGMTPAILLGKLFRLFGGDISIFPNFGGRFTFSTAECLDLAQALREPWGALRTAFPAPAGGMTIEKVGDMVSTYGEDTALLIGGALLRYSPDGAVSARAFVDALEQAVATQKVTD
jgi:ribulose-bisphosphate carboxylase large chain